MNEQHPLSAGEVDADGKPGHTVIRHPGGTTELGEYVNGLREGHWVIRRANGWRQQGPFASHKRHGHWVEEEARDR